MPLHIHRALVATVFQLRAGRNLNILIRYREPGEILLDSLR